MNLTFPKTDVFLQTIANGVATDAATGGESCPLAPPRTEPAKMPAYARPSITLATLLLTLLPTLASAQQWATGMVNTTSHNFGPVARGADVEYKFAFKNTFEEDIRLVDVKSSCGCTTPSIDKPVLKTYETGHVVAKFNTRTFTGHKSATLTVRLEFTDATGARRTGRVQLRVQGEIRGDLRFDPGSVDFGTVDQGTAVQRSISITRSGWSGWRIHGVEASTSDLEVTLGDPRRQGSRVTYELFVKLRESAMPGLVQQQIVLLTNDRRSPRVTLAVSGAVQPQLSVAPGTLAIGSTPVGATVTKRVIVRGKRPFRLTAIDCGGDQCFQFPGVAFDAAGPARTRHIVPIAFTPSQAGEVKRDLVFQTDLGEAFTATCTAYATVTEPEAATTATAATTKVALSD